MDKKEKDLTMLVVDDNRMNREILAVLFKADYNVFCVGNGEEALALLEEQKKNIDIVLLDLVMPGMDGFEILQKRRELDYFKDIPVVVITACSEQENQIRAFELGANDYINKPFVPEIVCSRVSNVMASRRRFLSIEQEARTMKIKSELDQMTGLYNKVTAEQVIADTLRRCESQLHAILVIDIDNFKSVNDTSGHLVGDHTIRIVADLISGHFRKSDVVGRIGGDEFIVMMVDIHSMETAREKVNALIQGMRYKPNLTIPENVALSIGFVGTEDGESDYETLFKRADEALYQAKQSGKAQAREYGAEIVAGDERDKKAVLLVSRNRGVCSTVHALMPQEIAVVEALDLEDLSQIKQEDTQRIVLAYVDASEVDKEPEKFWDTIYSYSWLQKIPVIALCREGALKQYRPALQRDIRDILGVPLEGTVFKRRTKKHLADLGVLHKKHIDTYPDKKETAGQETGEVR